MGDYEDTYNAWRLFALNAMLCIMILGGAGAYVSHQAAVYKREVVQLAKLVNEIDVDLDNCVHAAEMAEQSERKACECDGPTEGFIEMSTVADESKVMVINRTTMWLGPEDPVSEDLQYCVLNTLCFPCTHNGNCGFFEDYRICKSDCPNPRPRKPKDNHGPK